jgi:hypothetical protein
MASNARKPRRKKAEDPSERLFRMAMCAIGLGMLIGAIVAPEKGESVVEEIVPAVSK